MGGAEMALTQATVPEIWLCMYVPENVEYRCRAVAQVILSGTLTCLVDGGRDVIDMTHEMIHVCGLQN